MPVTERSELEKVAPLGTISRHTFRPSPLAQHTIFSLMPRSGMVSTRLLGVSLPCNPIRNIRENVHAVRARSLGEASQNSLVCRGPCVCPSRSRGRMQHRYLSRDLCSKCPSSQGRRGTHILRFCSVAKRARRSEGGGGIVILFRSNRSVRRRVQ